MIINTKFFVSSAILLLTLGVAHAESTKPLENNEFSDPDHIAKVDHDFADRDIQYGEKVGDVDVVISLGQQTYPALHKTVEEIARQQGITLDIQQGSCGSTAKKLLKKSVDIGTYCCPPGNTDRLPGLEFHTVAISPIALTTNSSNSIDLSLIHI